MDKKLIDLTVGEFTGLIALVLACFCLVLLIIRHYDPGDSSFERGKKWLALVALAGIPVYLGLRVLFPQLPVF